MKNRTASYLWKKMLVLNSAAAGAAGLIGIVLFRRTQSSEILHEFVYSLLYAFVIGSVIILTFARFGRNFYRAPFPVNWALITGVILACAVAGSLVADLALLTLGFLPSGEFWSTFEKHAPFCAIISLIFGLGAFAYELVRSDLEATTLKLRTKQLDEERARKSAIEAQLASLESHVRPHFLFNTLNTISSLIPEDPSQAEALVGKLAGVLRQSLDSNQHRLTPIEKELKLVRDFPAFSLQTLVENSVKYAVAPRLEGALIRIAAHERDGIIHLQVADDGPGFTSEAIRPGHGLANLQGRLSGLFGAAAQLEIATRDGLTSVSLSLPRPKMQAAV